MGRDWLLPLYDPFTRLLGAPAAHRSLIEQADLRAGHRVLEIGTGTGNLLLSVKRRHPDVAATGLDPDPRALARAARKARRAGVAIQLDRGFAGRLPYADGSFDRVFSAFMLHHLPAADRLAALREVRRVLAPGGSLHLLDLGGQGRPRNHVARLLHRRNSRHADPAHAHAGHGGAGHGGAGHGDAGHGIGVMLAEAGFTDPTETGEGAIMLSPYVSYRAGR
jgi:ubiquinone/menaquinone biosynthesis C-methylase UbiE